MRSDGWVRIVPGMELNDATRALYLECTEAFADKQLCASLRREVLFEADREEQRLALMYLGLHEEPLYDAGAAAQCVHSFNIHEVVTASELDARLPQAYNGDERALAHAYHAADSAGGSSRVPPLLAAAAALRASLTASVCAPLLSAFDALLGLEDGSLSRRCGGHASDNTSLLRCLEYPRAGDLADGSGGGQERQDEDDGEQTVGEAAGEAAGEAEGESSVWGVSAHTDFELFSLLHEDAPGLTLQDPSGAWARPLPRAAGAADAGGGGSAALGWVVLVGDMLARLSHGYFAPTPHRVPRTEPGAPHARHSIVYFNAFDELEPVTPLAVAVACRSVTGGFRRWWEGGGLAGERSREGPPAPARQGSRQRPASAAKRDSKRARARAPLPYEHPWAQLLQSQPMTQREWTELKEVAARERLAASVGV